MFPKDCFVVRVCKGCDSYCTYCGDKIVVGTLMSKPFEECISEVKKGLSLGHKKIHLIGDDIGAYGLDIGSSISELLKSIVGLGRDFKLSLDEVNIKYLIKNQRGFEKILSSGRIRSM